MFRVTEPQKHKLPEPQTLQWIDDGSNPPEEDHYLIAVNYRGIITWSMNLWIDGGWLTPDDEVVAWAKVPEYTPCEPEPKPERVKVICHGITFTQAADCVPKPEPLSPWITDRDPEEEGEYWVCLSFRGGNEFWYRNATYDIFGGWGLKKFDIRVIAWMPIVEYTPNA